MTLENKNILIITDNKKFKNKKFLKLFKACIKKEKASLTIEFYNNKFIKNFYNQQYDVIVFATKNNVKTVKTLKKINNEFASIQYLEGSFADELTDSIYNKFDTTISTTTIGCWNVNKCKFSEQRVIHKLKTAIKTHVIKHNQTIKMLDKFVQMVESKQDHTLINIIDSSGTVISADSRTKEIFGDIVGTNVIHENEFFRKLKEGEIIPIEDKNNKFIEMKLVSQWVFENGQTFYVQVWEVVEEVKILKNTIKKLDKVLKTFRGLK